MTNTVVNVVVAGLGGQGVVKASDVLADAAFRCGLDVKKSEIHGMSQRGGSVASDVRFGETWFVGNVKATWGLSIMDDMAYTDNQVVRGLGINRAFNHIPETEALIDVDGFKHRATMEKIKSANTVMVMGRAVFVEGAQ